MSEQDGMIEHGITTTKADYWIHFHPLEGRVYWYCVTHMREWINIHKIPVKIAKSKNPDRTPTGSGYCILKSCPILASTNVPEEFLKVTNWELNTDRENSRIGELLVAVLIERGEIRVPAARHAQLLRTQKQQFNGIDGKTLTYPDTTWEVKTETFSSNNLFVQLAERGHLPNFNRNGVERISSLAPFEDEVK